MDGTRRPRSPSSAGTRGYPVDVADPGPNPETTEAIFRFFQTEYAAVTANIDGLDRKAALLPPILGAAAGLLIGGQTTFTRGQLVLLIAALALGTIAGVFSVKAIEAKRLKAGPKTEQVLPAMTKEPRLFYEAASKTLAEAIDDRRAVSERKADDFNWAIRFAAGTLFVLALARIAGGI